MSVHISPRRLRTLLVSAVWVAVAQVGLALSASAQTMVESSAEARFQLDLHVPEAKDGKTKSPLAGRDNVRAGPRVHVSAL